MISLDTEFRLNLFPLFPPQGEGVTYFRTAENFLGAFPEQWSSVKKSFRKFEARQTYIQSSKSLETFYSSGRNAALALMEPSASEKQYHAEIKDRGAHYIRIRPVALPLTRYLEWEILSYQMSEKMGQDIRFVDCDYVATLARKYDADDFMIFDDHSAMMHNYTESGMLVGGWLIKRQDVVSELVRLFEDLELRSVPMSSFLELHPQFKI